MDSHLPIVYRYGCVFFERFNKNPIDIFDSYLNSFYYCITKDIHFKEFFIHRYIENDFDKSKSFFRNSLINSGFVFIDCFEFGISFYTFDEVYHLLYLSDRILFICFVEGFMR